MQLALVVGAICDTKNVVWIQAELKPQRRHTTGPKYWPLTPAQYQPNAFILTKPIPLEPPSLVLSCLDSQYQTSGNAYAFQFTCST